VTVSFRKQQWKKLIKAFQKATVYGLKKISSNSTTADSTTSLLNSRWHVFQTRVSRFEANLSRIESGFAFTYIDGVLINAMRHGHWVLLDEINLAAPETLQVLSGILDGRSFCLTDKGDVEVIAPHSHFKIFAAMNPPTDVGKKELPISLRSRFTEIYVQEMTDPNDLKIIVTELIGNISGAPIDDIVSLYLACRASAEEHLEDGAGQRPKYSLRSLTRALKATRALMEVGIKPLVRALYEAFVLIFQTQLSEGSKKFLKTYLQQFLQLSDTKSLSHPPPRPGGRSSEASQWSLIKPFWVRAGPLSAIDWAHTNEAGIQRFVLTPTVEVCLRDIAAGIAANVSPILLQGPTSVGKTTMIEYLASR
jgi:midasin